MIKIANRLRPFSHLPGTRCLIPGSTTVVQTFPTLVRIGTEEFPINAPAMTVVQDLERGCISILGGKGHYHVLPSGQIVHTKHSGTPPLGQERLCLGIHKKQDWEGIRRRCDFCEILPFWFRLGALLPPLPEREEKGGMFALLEAVRSAIASGRPETIAQSFERLFLAGFGGLLVPRMQDSDYYGFVSESVGGNPLHLLAEGSALIRSLFLCTERGLHFLPHLPPECHAGRMTGIETPFGTLAIEWSKKLLRRVALRARIDGTVPLSFQPALKRMRLASERRVVLCSEPLEIKAGALYLLDNFQK